MFCFLYNTGVNQRNTFKIQYDIAHGKNSSKHASVDQKTNDTVNHSCIDNCENTNNDQVSFEGARVFLNDTSDINK